MSDPVRLIDDVFALGLARHADRCASCRPVWLSRGPLWLLCPNGRHLLAVAWVAGKGAGR